MMRSDRPTWLAVAALLALLLSGCLPGRVPDDHGSVDRTPTSTSSSSAPAPTTAPPSAQPERHGKAYPPFVGKDMAEWRQFWKAGHWKCSERPSYETSKTITCSRRDARGADMIDMNTNTEGGPGSLMVLTATSPKRLPHRWQNLIKSLEPIIGPAMVDLTLAEGDGGGFDYWDAVDVATHSGFRAMFTYDLIGGGTNPAEIDLRKMIKKVTASGGTCDAYSCLGPAERYHVRYGVEPTTTEILSVSDPGTQMAAVWDSLGQLGKDVESLRKIKTQYATGVVGDYAAVRSIEKGKEVVYLADSGGLFRGSPPSGKKPKPPTMPPR